MKSKIKHVKHVSRVRRSGGRTPVWTSVAALTLLAAVLVSVPAVAAGPGVVVDADTQYGYAEHLFLAGDYAAAVSEYRRFMYLFPRDARLEGAMFKIGAGYMAMEQWHRAVQSFSQLIEMFDDGSFTFQAYFKTSEAYLEMGRTASAVTNLHNLATIAEDIDVQDQSYYRIGWIHLEMAEWKLAEESFAKISPKNRTKYRLDTLAEAVNKAAADKKKRPGLAGVLSIIPGGGYLYCERYQDALIALLLNGGLILAAYEAFDNELYALAGVITFVEVGFYAGNIYGAMTSAHKYNQRSNRRSYERLQQSFRVGLSVRPDNQGLELALKIPLSF